MKALKLAMIGAGSRANAVIFRSFNDLQKKGKVEFAGLCDIDAERREKTADQYGIKNRYGEGGVFDYQRMINEQRPDAAVVIGQPHLMYDIWMWCLEQGINLFIEKPLGLSMHQAQNLTAVAKRKGVVTQVSFQRRYSPMVTIMRNECLKRGPITHVVCKFYKNEIKDMLGARDRMMDDSVHAIDTLRWMTGSEVVKIDSITDRVCGTVDINFIMAQMTFENGTVGHLMNNWTSGKRIFAVEMHAPGVYIEAEHETGGRLYADGSLAPTAYDAAGCAGSDEFHVLTGVKAAARDFVNACLYGGRPMCDFSDAVKTMKVAETILAKALLEEDCC